MYLRRRHLGLQYQQVVVQLTRSDQLHGIVVLLLRHIY